MFIDIVLACVISLIMFGIGSSLRIEDFKNVFIHSKAVTLGLTLQMLFLPLFAMLVAYLSNLPPEFRVGIFIVSICPGGTISNCVSYLVKADVALSIALTSINSILILFTIPVFSSLAVSFFMSDVYKAEVVMESAFLQVLYVLILPTFLGVIFNEKLPWLSKKIRKPLRIANAVLLAIIVSINFFAGSRYGGRGVTASDVMQILPCCLIVHAGAMLISYFISLKITLNKRQATTIGIEVGLQNTTLALLVSSSILANNDITKPALVFAVFTFWTTLIFAFWSIKRSPLKEFAVGLKSK